MARSRGVRLTSLTLANILLPVAAIVFALGFFPFKPLLPGLATFEDVREPQVWGAERPEAVFDRVVFMVVDALRSDFVYGHNSGFEFTQSLIQDGAAVPFTAHATPPTVTMPRVKAITTGSVPSFADLIFNLDESGSGSTLATQDTWLAQIKAQGGKLVFYGDDTWLRLFPNEFFARSDGTSSFFVSDFTEVDNNVTRHIPEELENSDWNAMIMHYLGLDHIGHKTGPNGPHMLPKQREMDGIVRQIYKAMETMDHHENTLLVLAGDHGMNAGGNHGGSGPGETEPALLFASPKLKQRQGRKVYECPTLPKEDTEFHYYGKVEQSDIVPTLAGLMQLPISKNSLGVFIEDLAGCWSAEHGTWLLYENGKQMRKIIEAALGFDAFNTRVSTHAKRLNSSDHTPCSSIILDGVDDELACRWATAEHFLQQPPNSDPKRDHALLLEFLNTAQETLSSVASSYDIGKMTAGMSISALSVGLAVFSIPHPTFQSAAGVFFGLTSILYGIMMFASSYVEEEQHFWYWLTPAWVAVLTVKGLANSRGSQTKLRLAMAGAAILAIHRIIVRWNQTGQKHAGEPDIVHAIFPNEFVLMWVLILITYGYVCYMLIRHTFLDLFPVELGVPTAIILIFSAIVFKLNFTQADAPELVQGLAYQIREWSTSFSLVLQAQVSLVLLATATFTVILASVSLARNTVLTAPGGPAVRTTLPERLHYLLTLFLITQSRAPNVPLFLGLECQRHALQTLLDASQFYPMKAKSTRNAALSPAELATSIVVLSHTYFFCIGGSNSISSVDLSQAYNGVGDYNIVAVGVLLFASNWTGPIWWCSAAVWLTFANLSDSRPSSQPYLNGGRRWIEVEREKLHDDAITAFKANTRADEGRSIPEHWRVYVSFMTAFVATSLLAVMAACTILRTHLFIWTVFSPKYLYTLAWCIGWHLLVNIGLGSLLRLLGQIA